MRLYLSSYRLGNHVDRLVGLLPRRPRVLIVSNALDLFSKEARQVYSSEVYNPHAELESLGFVVGDLELRDYFHGNPGLDERLHDADLVWVLGGNAFVLRRSMAMSGFDTAILHHLREEKITYGGFSAGAVMAPRTLHGIEFMDDPGATPEGYTSDIVWDGLGLIDFSIIPHYQSDHPETGSAAITRAHLMKQKLPFEALRDGDVVLQCGNVVEILR